MNDEESTIDNGLAFVVRLCGQGLVGFMWSDWSVVAKLGEQPRNVCVQCGAIVVCTCGHEIVSSGSCSLWPSLPSTHRSSRASSWVGARRGRRPCRQGTPRQPGGVPSRRARGCFRLVSTN